MKTINEAATMGCILGTLVWGMTVTPCVANQSKDAVTVYEVNRKVSDFPAEEDLSTPEAAYATLNRLSATGDQAFWPRLSIPRLAQNMPAGPGKREVSKSARDEWLNAEILEVHVFRGTYAGVIAKVPHPWKGIFDYRSLEFEQGRWLNAGNGVFGSLEEARKSFEEACDWHVKKPARPRIDDPEAYLQPFVEFLRQSGAEPRRLVMKALAEHKVAILGEIHHRPRYWAFNASLVADPDFARRVGTIYLELPSNGQELIDEFLASERCDTMLVIRMLRDMLWMGWPDQPMLDFFVAVWKVNRRLPPEQRLRIVLVDMQRPWQEIRWRRDWQRYEVDRDRYMAENILRDIRERPAETRNRLFIVGVGHAGVNLKYYSGRPRKTAGRYLQEELGQEHVYAVFPHHCVMTNAGRVDGRLCLGLFDSAFAALGNKPVAFPLDTGPFGAQPYDADPEDPLWCDYRDGFSAYLCLGPLEDEVFAPLIPGFYSDAFVKELDRRHQLMFNKPLVEGCGLARLDGESFAGWMSGSWGQPRDWRNELGPLDAWKYGDNWEQEVRKQEHEDALKHSEVIRDAANRLFDAIRHADYQHHADGRDWGSFLPETVDYRVHHHFDRWVQWICRTLSRNPIESVELGPIFKNGRDLPAVPYQVVLRDGRRLAGTLPLMYLPRQGRWMGVEGLDWHLQYGDSPEAPARPESAARSPTP